MIKAILFDLDGTLVDTTEFIYQAYEYVLSLHGFEVIKRNRLAPYIGRSLQSIYQEIAPEGNVHLLMETHTNFQAKNFHLVKSFPSISEIIDKLKRLGFKLGIVTSRYKNAHQTLEAAGIQNTFDVIITADDVTRSKPDPQGIFLALKSLKLKPNQALFVGDAKADIEMGKNAEVKTVAVTYGFGGKDIKNSNPDYVIDDIGKLLEVLKLK